MAYGDNSQCTQRTVYSEIETMLTGERKKKLKCDNDYRKSGTFHNFSTCLTRHTGFACGIKTYFVTVVVFIIVDAVAVAVIAATVLVLRYLSDSPLPLSVEGRQQHPSCSLLSYMSVANIVTCLELKTKQKGKKREQRWG